ncbi:MAG: tetratricopeptide repeat protein [Candidatus Marinimicrobia bacterium]|nr:tetratricopeptide repeat protein [Candidatus Neomarinimicrobiota bacterium]
MLNSYAWRMAELEMNLEDALDKIQMAVAKLDDASAEQKAQVKDTHAEVLWKLGQTDKALAVIDECIALQPDDSYYQEQKAKYQSETG